MSLTTHVFVSFLEKWIAINSSSKCAFAIPVMDLSYI
jgi:hypothetical protein